MRSAGRTHRLLAGRGRLLAGHRLSRHAWCFAWPEYGVVVEVDGFDYHQERADYLADRRKSNELTRLGYVLLRYEWEDVVLRPDHVIAQVRGMLSSRGWSGDPPSS
ncbi:MAG: endonuclease domain-containing protein [Frankiaceae bacterium]